MKPEDQDTLKAFGDALSIFTVVGTLIDMLPSVAALFTIIWTGIRIYESETVQAAIARWKNRVK